MKYRSPITATDEAGTVASVTVDGELADFEMEQKDGEIKIEFTLTTDDGTYEVACKPGMAGDGIRTEITVGS